jgi:uncharacterized protein YndB with AHSA1/START domain
MRAIVKAVLIVVVLGTAGRVLRAEVKGSAPDSLIVSHAATLRAAPAAVYRALGEVGKWWSDQHTWSGAARNLIMELRAGGCFCEAWSAGTVEHGRVVFAQTNEMLRLNAALGPLQELAVSGVLTFKLTPAASGGTQLDVIYRASGDATHALDKLAPIVDSVIGEQVARFARFAETGRAAQ